MVLRSPGETWNSIRKRTIRFALIEPVRLVSPTRAIAIERRVRGWEQLGKLERADHVIVSYGKSGRTWLRVMLSRILQLRHGLPESVLIGYDNMHLVDRAAPIVFFTHDNYTRDYTGNRDSKRDYYAKPVLLLVRHPADVAVSQYHQWRHRMQPRKQALNDYPEAAADLPLGEFLLDHATGLAGVIAFMNAWAAELERMPRLHLLRYEDMKQDAKQALAGVLAFFGIPADDAMLAEAVSFASFDNMRRLESSEAFAGSSKRMKARDASDPLSFKTRRGEAGAWRDELAPEEARAVAELIDRTLAPGFGYTSAEAAAARPVPDLAV